MLYDYFLELLGFPSVQQSHLPSPRKDHHVGSTDKPYKVRNTTKERRNAIKSGINELKQLFENNGLNKDDALFRAVDAKRRRLILIRTLHRNKPSCNILHGDVLWLYDNYRTSLSGKSELKFQCTQLN